MKIRFLNSNDLRIPVIESTHEMVLHYMTPVSEGFIQEAWKKFKEWIGKFFQMVKGWFQKAIDFFRGKKKKSGGLSPEVQAEMDKFVEEIMNQSPATVGEIAGSSSDESGVTSDNNEKDNDNSNSEDNINSDTTDSSSEPEEDKPEPPQPTPKKQPTLKKPSNPGKYIDKKIEEVLKIPPNKIPQQYRTYVFTSIQKACKTYIKNGGDPQKKSSAEIYAENVRKNIKNSTYFDSAKGYVLYLKKKYADMFINDDPREVAGKVIDDVRIEIMDIFGLLGSAAANINDYDKHEKTFSEKLDRFKQSKFPDQQKGIMNMIFINNRKRSDYGKYIFFHNDNKSAIFSGVRATEIVNELGDYRFIDNEYKKIEKTITNTTDNRSKMISSCVSLIQRNIGRIFNIQQALISMIKFTDDLIPKLDAEVRKLRGTI